MKKILNVFVCTLSLIPMIGFGQIVKTVEASGMGSSEKSALLDASRNAVSQVVTTLVESQTTTLDEDIVEDKIIAVSGGFIDNLKVIEPAVKNDSGFYLIKIKADVKYDQLSTEIAKYSSTSVSVDMGSLIAGENEKQKAEEQAKLVRAKQQEAMGEFFIKVIDDYVKAWKFDITKIKLGKDSQEVVISLQGSLSNDNYISKFVLPTQKRLKELNLLQGSPDKGFYFSLYQNLLKTKCCYYPIEIFNDNTRKPNGFANKEVVEHLGSKLCAKKYILRVEVKNAKGDILTSQDIQFARDEYNGGPRLQKFGAYSSVFKIEIIPQLSNSEKNSPKLEKLMKFDLTLRVYPPHTISDISKFDIQVLQVDKASPCDAKW